MLLATEAPVHGPYVFAGSPVERVDFRRRDAGWIAERLADGTSRVLPVWRLAVPVSGSPSALAWAGPAAIRARDVGTEPVLLGVVGERACFAVDVSARAEPAREIGLGDATFPDLRGVASLLPAGEAAIAAQARHLVDWHARHRFCSVCGRESEPCDGGYVRRCSASACKAEHFPRTDPVAIMLVVRGDRCLLGRQAKWPAPFFSALAGFVEPGETLEEAVRREVKEEAGIEVGRVSYHSSQPWPFPASLMLGCLADGVSEAITVDRAELEDARWFGREQVRAALAGSTKDLALPPPLAIAHQLARAWAEGGATPG
jgi:NAD+ diphosphatase